ncbi:MULTISPECIES: nuclease-related domain-containing DEAD/DEAH box helicase [Pseudomonas]|uniref:nuclease-related domain-containing DEAD/DEAH box helicase n=1 Tax=Pseudomonas TaxID=286 RepID=UPI0008636842|nr:MULTISPECIES: UvrD-helicase domain-containing protein [Pseudomonas]EKT4495429.1 UvrD-helicase domain-containing protein [Pseudomonas putida]EKT4528823.1 UvrD-helicase domain-containing protein [Pseudomonas putida]EKT8867114.1 UvrD-helicase domain-containing protein [Pseudomonas putida]UFH25203.1 UvrD-helicase domain-containing protein [Pseudomonas sp. CIP-10]
MAKIIPGIEEAKLSRQSPTEGELFLLFYLRENFDPEAEVYFQPCFNGERPDVVIIKKGVGAIVVEVKDWNLSSYSVDVKNQWRLLKNQALLRSPFSQAFAYKQNLFEVHANGLLDKSMASETFYGLIKVYVYFHNATKNEIAAFYEPAMRELRSELDEVQQAFREKKIGYEQYEKKRLYLSNKKKQLERDLGSLAITRDSLKRIAFSGGKQNPQFEEGVYAELMRLLQPPFHYANEGKPILYTKPQVRLSESIEGARAKVCGVAGSGKTSVLAKRAVNAHRRHGEPVLILTFNLTLRMFIRDKISEVREDFSWGAFHIVNYHKFMSAALSSAGIDVKVPEGLVDSNAYLEEHYYSNESVLANYVADKYKTILIDEAQDYKPEWQRIIRMNFLAEGGEMVLFADEKQNIYERAVDEEKRANIISGFGRWQKLNKSFRYKQDSPVLQLSVAFQKQFLSEKYVFDGDESYQQTAFLPGISLSAVGTWSADRLIDVAELIVAIAKREGIHPNDITIVSSREDVLREVDFAIRKGPRHQERTITSFASKEDVERVCGKRLGRAEEKKELRQLSASRKQGFNLNSGVMKLSTLHSFKGFESPTIFVIVNDLDGPELVYAGLTRAKENIVVLLPDGSRYFDFFVRNLDVVDLYVQRSSALHASE